MAAKKKKLAKKSKAPTKQRAAKKKTTKGAPKKAKKSAPKKAKKSAPKKAKKSQAKNKMPAPAKSSSGLNGTHAAATAEHEVIALPGKRKLAIGGAYKGANLDHHPVSKRELDEVAHGGLRGDGEILHVEEAEFSPCRLVDHGEGRFSLCLDDFKMPERALFQERGLQGGGYTWEAVVASLVKLRRPDLEGELNYDSESGMFVALGARDALRTVAKLIQQAMASDSVLQEAVDAADPDRLE